MDSKYFRKALGWCIFIFFILACVSPLASASTPVPLPAGRMQQTLNAAIAGTAAAAQTQTVTMRPPTFTPTVTPLPSKTPTPSAPSPTLFYYSFFTATYEIPIQETMDAATATAARLKSINAIDLGGGYIITAIPADMQTDQNQWRCAIRSTPHPVVQPGKKFTAYWTVVNTGWHAWTSNTIDFVYISGIRGGKANIQDIPSTVGYGRTLTVGTTFTAPKKLGEFHSRYVLKVDATRLTEVCSLRLTFQVKW